MESTDGRRLVPPGLITAVLAISLAAIFFKKAQPTHPLASAGIRLAIAAVLLSPFTLRAARAGRLPPRIVRAGLLAGLLYGVHFGAWVASLELTTIAASVTLVTITPLFLAIAGVITGTDRPSGAVWLALGVAVVGITIIGGTDLGTSRDALIGDALACLGSIAIAGYLLLARRLGKDLDVLALTGIVTLDLKVFSLHPFAQGDADLYASFHVARPDSRHYNFSSMSAGLSTDVLRFGSAALCPRRPCTLSLGVLGYKNASFSIVSNQDYINHGSLVQHTTVCKAIVAAAKVLTGQTPKLDCGFFSSANRGK